MSRALKIITNIFEAKKGTGPMYTISELMEAVNNRGEPRHISILRTTPLMGNKTLTIKAEARGTKLYPMTLTFYNVDYSWEKDGEHPLVVRPELGKVAYMAPISESGNPVQLRCQCPSFRFDYAHWDKQNKVLSGPPFPFYQRKTTTMPERNPCFVGSTKIKLLDGTVKTLEELSNIYNEEDIFWVYSCDNNGKFVPGKAYNPRITAHVTQLVKITLDSGDVEICTPNHLWMLRNGNYIEAKDLNCGTSLMPLYTKISDSEDDYLNLGREGYEMIFDNQEMKWEYTHIRTTEECDISKSSSNAKVRHHIDFNKLNNSPENIVFLEWQEHRDLHASLGGWKYQWENNLKYREKMYPIQIDNLDRGREKIWNDPEFHEYREKMKKMGSQSMKNNWKSEEFVIKHKNRVNSEKNKNRIRDAGKNTRFTSDYISNKNIKNWQDNEYREKMSKMISESRQEWWLTEKGNEERTRRSSIEGKIEYQRKRILNMAKEITESGVSLTPDTWDENVRSYFLTKHSSGRGGRYKNTVEKYFEGGVEEVISTINHKVKKVEFITLDTPIPVYDITTEPHHNFALESGVFVHNSHKPGMCKHLISLVTRLKKDRILS